MHNNFKLLRTRLSYIIVQKMPFYAVAKGRKTGIFLTWEDCKCQVNNFKKPVFRKFVKLHEARAFLALHGTDHIMKYRDGRPMKRATSPKPQQCGFWPDNVNDNENNILIAATEEVGDSGGNPKKRKCSSSSSKNKLGKHESISEPVGIKKFGKFDFPIDSEGYVIVYTDGSCSGNGTISAVAGFGVYFSENHPLNTASPVIGRATNNCGEIQAAICAIKLARDIGISKLCINTDSQFLINSITIWLSAWKAKGWHLSSGRNVKNKEDFMKLDQILKSENIKVKWKYVKAHNGIVGNENADQLARQGADMYRKLKNSKINFDKLC